MGFQSSINAVLGTGAAIAVASKKLPAYQAEQAGSRARAFGEKESSLSGVLSSNKFEGTPEEQDLKRTELKKLRDEYGKKRLEALKEAYDIYPSQSTLNEYLKNAVAREQRKALGADNKSASAPEQQQANEYIPVSEIKAAQADGRIARNVVQKQTQKQAVSRRKQLLQERIKAVIGGLDDGIDK